MLMVILGAGASYDSDPGRPADRNTSENDRPPLANQLFLNRAPFTNALSPFSECAPIVPLLRAASNIELELERLRNEATEHPPYPQRLRQIAGVRGYLQMLFSGLDKLWHSQANGSTNYTTLLDQILRWGHQSVLLVTFNYDRLLELAVHTLTNHQFDGVEDYVHEPFAVLKLHGSVDWGRVVLNPPQSTNNDWQDVRALIASTASIQVSDEYIIADARPIVRDPAGRLLVPAIAIPVQSKQDFACPKSHLQALRDRLPEVDKILIVGWRGMDHHLVAILKEQLRPDVEVQIVCKDSSQSQSVVETLTQTLPGLRYEPLDAPFSTYVAQRLGEKFIRG
jgi:hypothetical protein